MDKFKQFDSAVAEIVGNSDTTLVEAVSKICHACYEAADGKGNDYSTLKDMALWLLAESNVLNVYHWNASVMTKHELLQEAYELCRDTGDKLAETYMSITDNACTGKADNVVGLTEKEGTDEEALKLLETLQENMQGAVSKNDEFSEGIKNIFADFDESITKIIYKYKQFKA